VKGNVFKKVREKTLSNHFETSVRENKASGKESLLLRRNVVENHLPTQSLTWDSQPLPAYQYFENVRNFLMVVKELKLLAFDASDLKTEAYEVRSTGRVVDCILALKAYHGWKQINGGTGVSKCTKSPLLSNSLKVSFANAHRRLNMPIADESLSLEEAEAIELKAVASVDEAINTLVEALLGYGGNDELLGSVRSVEVLRLFTVLRPSSEDDEEDHEMREDVDSSDD
ncbi:hypothetical protein Dimus_002015, partial [Dionaea muscipula]